MQHFGKEIIAKELQVDEGHIDVQRLFLAVYKSFMEVTTKFSIFFMLFEVQFFLAVIFFLVFVLFEVGRIPLYVFFGIAMVFTLLVACTCNRRLMQLTMGSISMIRTSLRDM